jgi:hypothetical protein
MKVVTQGKRRGGDPASAAYSPDTQNVLQTNNRFSRFPRPQAEIRAELIGSDEGTAAGLTIRGRAPVLALCRQLIADGHDPGLPLEVWRGPVLCLRVRSIGEAAQLRVATHGLGFEHLHGCAAVCTAASPVEETPVRLCPTPGRPKRTSEAAVP